MIVEFEGRDSRDDPEEMAGCLKRSFRSQNGVIPSADPKLAGESEKKRSSREFVFWFGFGEKLKTYALSPPTISSGRRCQM